MRSSNIFLTLILGASFLLSPAAFALQVIPTVKKIPAMRGNFVEADWAKDSLKLSSFTMIPKQGAPKVTPPAKEKTIVYAKRDKNTLYMALILLDEDVISLMKTQKKDRKLPPWRLNGIEIFLGSENSFIQLAFDYMGRLYKNARIVYFTHTIHKRDRIIIRVGIPLKDVPRSGVSQELVRLGLYRKSKSGISSAVPSIKNNFKDMTLAQSVLLASGKDLANSMTARYEKEIEKLFKASSLTKEDRVSLLAALQKKKASLLASLASEKKLFAALKDFNTMDEAISKAQEKCLRNQLGIRKKGKIVAEKPFTALPELWRPQKIYGKDFWYTYSVYPKVIELFEKTGIMKEPLFREGMFFVHWSGNNSKHILNPKSSLYKLMERYSTTPFAVKTPCPRYLSEKARKHPDHTAFWNKSIMDEFYKKYGKRFQGFWSDECFVSGPSNFAESMDYYKLARPKTREEAYNLFKIFYHKKTKSTPHHIPFRNLANMSPYTAKDAMNCAAVQLNHLVYALGDKMSGNETGDVMGPMAAKLSFARGAARQYSRPWRNYNTYYSWLFLNEVGGGGRCNTIRGGLWNDLDGRSIYLHENCRFQIYCHIDGPRCGIAPDRQKPFILYPYLAGASVWYSEADLGESVAVYKPGEKTDILVRNLRDQKLYLSEITQIHSHFYNNIVKKRDRGVMLTPVGLVYDRAHGYLPLYFGETIWDQITPNEIEKTMWALERHLYKAVPGNPSYTNCKYGDIFDVITNESSEKILATYKVLYLVGDVTLDKKFAAKLKNYVKNGGTLIVNSALLKKYANALDAGFLGAGFTGKEGSASASYSRITGKVITEEQPYKYLEMVPSKGTEVLVYTADAAKKPAVMRKKVGKGFVFVTTPANMKVEKQLHKMLSLFDHLMEIVKNETIPITVKTSMQYAFCRNKNGYVVYMQNNEKMPPSNGVIYGKAYPREYLKVKSDAEIFFPSTLGNVKEVIDWWTGKKVSFRKVKGGFALKTTIRGGECQVLEFVTGK